MAVNPDPRPGRWLLPLVILGMVLFTYVFVQALPSADENGDDLSSGATTTTSTTAPETDETTTTTTEPVQLDPSVQTFLDLVAEQEAALTGFQTEMATINGQWDATERTVTYTDTEAALTDLAARVRTWAEGVATTVAPLGLEGVHTVLSAAAAEAANASDAVLAGLRSSDTGEARRAALDSFDEAVRAFTAAADEADFQAALTS
ncbi:MAG TPA: hypothetical protein VLB67_02560 [Acidimicrobiia bacterium]|nr:hypothetical protein [Acidimicrobiia bacterium]